MAGRLLLRRTLAGLLDCEPQDVPVSIDARGRPHLAGEPWSFSLSHSGGRLVLAVSSIPVGIDLQVADASLEDGVAETFATPRERAAIRCADDLYTLWTKKEAVLKCLGTGFHTDPRTLELGELTSVVLKHPGGETWNIAVRQRPVACKNYLAIAWRQRTGSSLPLLDYFDVTVSESENSVQRVRSGS